LKRLIDSGATIGKFEMVEPSLNDIFIAKITENNEKVSGNRKA